MLKRQRNSSTLALPLQSRLEDGEAQVAAEEERLAAALQDMPPHIVAAYGKRTGTGKGGGFGQWFASTLARASATAGSEAASPPQAPTEGNQQSVLNKAQSLFAGFSRRLSGGAGGQQ